MPLAFLAQKEGDTWVIGYHSAGSPDYSIMHFTFDGSFPTIEWHFEEDMHMRETSANICDSNGEAIIWTNGMQIFGKNGVSIEDTISYDFVFGGLSYWEYYDTDLYGPLGFPNLDGALVLPVPESENEYEVIYHTSDVHPVGFFQVVEYLSARIRINADSTYTTLYKDIQIGPHLNWYSSTISACRHANGRDWWITTILEDSPEYYVFILDPEGVRLSHIQTLDAPIREGLGQSTYSNSGSMIAHMDAITFNEGQYITLLAFDRCTGTFELMETLHSDAGYYTGPAFSPSERYLYTDESTKLWQWDLWAADIAASKTLVDTFDGFIEPGWFVTNFGPLKLAPDGRIYIAPTGGSSKRLHVIDRPDLPAAHCRFLQHHINLEKWNGRSMPNIPNFRLGPLDGSPCDTLGINNLPQSRWRYEEDVPSIVDIIRFTDLSFYDPDSWHWDFDDGSTSSEPSPLHTFDPGLYHVCLTVSNEFALDSSCQWIEILPTGLEDEWYSDVHDLSVSPNPFTDELIIRSRSGTFREAVIDLYDTHGHAVISRMHLPVPVTIKAPSLSPGMYLCVIWDSDGSVYQQKVMKL
jgi:hypothetical protein